MKKEKVFNSIYRDIMSADETAAVLKFQILCEVLIAKDGFKRLDKVKVEAFYKIITITMQDNDIKFALGPRCI